MDDTNKPDEMQAPVDPGGYILPDGKYLTADQLEERLKVEAASGKSPKESEEAKYKLANFYLGERKPLLAYPIFKAIREATDDEERRTKCEKWLEVILIKEPPEGHYEIQANPMLVASMENAEYRSHKDWSFHVDHYCFDSGSEKNYFDKTLRDTSIAKVWFTGMFKHGQSEFFIPYIDPESHTLRSYYPDFLVKKSDGKYQVVEVKADNKIDAAVVVAKKEAAEALTRASQMDYVLLQSSNLLPVLTTDAPGRKLPLFEYVTDYARRMFKDLLPVYSLEAACGKFGEGREVKCEGWAEVKGRRLDERMFISRAVGRSMEPTIHDGDYCIFRANPEGTRQGKIVLVQHRGIEDPETGGSYTIKIYSSEKVASDDEGWRHSKVILSPLNREFEPIEIQGRSAEDSDFRVIAEIVAAL